MGPLAQMDVQVQIVALHVIKQGMKDPHVAGLSELIFRFIDPLA